MKITRSGDRYNFDYIDDSFTKNGKAISGIKGYCSFLGWILRLFKFAIVIHVNDKNYYLNRKSAIQWLNRHGQALEERGPESLILQLFQKVVTPPNVAKAAEAPSVSTETLSEEFSIAKSGHFLSKKNSSLGNMQALQLTDEETQTIDQFVAEHKKSWKKKKFVRMRYQKEAHALPRTIDVFKGEDGRLYIMILGKKKGGLTLIGQGMEKKAYLAVDWETKEKYVDLVIASPANLDKKYQELQKEKEIATRAAQGAQIAKPPIDLRIYENKEREKKIGMYMPLYYCSLDQLNSAKLNNKQKKQIIIDLLRGMISLKQAKIDHRDLKSGNILIELQDNIWRAFIADFGASRQEVRFRLSKEEFKDRYANYAGNPSHKSPERILARKLYADYENEKRRIERKVAQHEKQQALTELENGPLMSQVKELIDTTWTQHADWAVGLLCLDVLAQAKETTSKELFDFHAIQIEQVIGDLVYQKKLIDDLNTLYHELQSKVDEHLSSFKDTLENPEELKLFSLIEQLLRVNPAERQRAETALATLEN